MIELSTSFQEGQTRKVQLLDVDCAATLVVTHTHQRHAYESS